MIVKYINENPDKFTVKNNVPNEIRDLGDLELGNLNQENAIISTIENDAPLKNYNK